jgi:hypothetical protein
MKYNNSNVFDKSFENCKNSKGKIIHKSCNDGKQVKNKFYVNFPK